MWFLNPGRDALYAVLSRILTPYVSNLDLTKFEAGLWAGQFSVNNLRLKKSALDKFKLPVDVIEGHLGHLTLNIPWANLTSKPAEIIIEDLYILAVPAGESKVDLEEDEIRTQAAKQERIKNSEVLHASGRDITSEDDQKNQGIFESLISKIVNNLQITVRNIHIRYEDALSVPGHPFAAGVTLSGFSAVSTNGNWEPTFIQSTAGAVHKLAKLDSLAVYFNTDSASFANQSQLHLLAEFRTLISHHGEQLPNHQFILRPVTGEGRITINRRPTSDIAKIGAELLFDEIGFVVDDDQYRDAISMVDMYHFYLRQYQYRRFRPDDAALKKNRSQALLRFAGSAILNEVHEKNRRWTWGFFKERRDDRLRYVDLFKQRESGIALSPQESSSFEKLERKLVYEDIRFYRSIGRSQLRRERAKQKKVEAEQKKDQPQPSGWLAWAWGSASVTSSSEGETGSDGMTDAQRKELYDAIDYDEKEAVASGLTPSRDVMNLRISAQLRTGSLALRSKPRVAGSQGSMEIMSMVFEGFKADVIQRPENLEAALTLNAMRVRDGTTPGTLYPEIIHMKDGQSISIPILSTIEAASSSKRDVIDPFFFFKFEHNPLDDRADNAITIKMKAMEIIYHRGYIEAIYTFLKPPASQLESVGALLNAANQTLEGLRNQTRAGLEYALQNHKTIDMKVDMSAPIIIIPEDVKQAQCQHLVLDAGHISIESELADKAVLREVQLKRNQQYTDSDFQRLESLMYDKFVVTLHSTQLLMGEDLQMCLEALKPEQSGRELHILERIDIEFVLHMSIIADALNLTRFKVSGKLPTLAANISNAKYKGLMRIVDIAIPHLSDDELSAANPHGNEPGAATGLSREPALSSGLFGGNKSLEYTVDDGESNEGEENDEEQFFDTEEDTSQLAKARQRTFEFSFEVEKLQASLFKTDTSGVDRLLAEAILDRFALRFSLAKYDMRVDVSLRSSSLSMVETSSKNGRPSLPLLSTSQGSDSDSDVDDAELVHIKYVRVQPASPEYYEVYEAIDQNVDISLSTFIFSASPEPVLALYDFIMTTFVSKPSDSNSSTPPPEEVTPINNDVAPSEVQKTSDKIRVMVHLTSVQLILLDGACKIATLALSSANVSVLLRYNSIRVEVRLGSLSLSDDSDLPTKSLEYKQILSIEGHNLADFNYETFDPEAENFPGVDSTVYLRSGSLKMHFAEKPLHDIYQFLVKFARLKSLYDSATQAAVQRASEIQRMKFDISIQSPLIIFPSGSINLDDKLVMRLGEVVAHNEYKTDVAIIFASLSGISLTSEASVGPDISELTIVDSVSINIEARNNLLEVELPPQKPNNEVRIGMTDLKVSVTESQYCAIMQLSQSLPRVFATGEGPAVQPGPQPDPSLLPGDEYTDLAPELRPSHIENGADPATRVALDLVFSVTSVRLHLYNKHAIRLADFKDNGIARFSLNHNTVRVKMLSDGSTEAEVALQSFTMTNTRPGLSRFREIIPAQKNREQAQFMILYTSAGSGPNQSSLVLVTIDSPKILFALDPIFALLTFFTSAFPPNSAPTNNDSGLNSDVENPANPSTMSSPLAFRLDLHDVSITVLENDEQINSQAIQLTVKQLLMSQQGIFALTVNRLGMSLKTMQSADSMSFLDELDLTLSLDSRQSSTHQMTSLELAVQPIIVRASLGDINLITSIVLRAVSLFTTRSNSAKSTTEASTSRTVSRPAQSSRKSRSSASDAFNSRRLSSDKPRVHILKEKLRAQFEGLRLVLIGNLYQLPIMHLNLNSFEVNASDWSRELNASTSISMNINYWNLMNSHWEPLIDPWTLSAQVARGIHTSTGLVATFSSRDRLDVNVTSTFLELALTTLSTWGSEDKTMKVDRSGVAPYKIRNRTGDAVVVFNTRDNSARTTPEHSVRLSDGETIDWRFDDSKTMREYVSSARNNTIGIQFQGKPWEPLQNVPVDQEGEYVYVLRPRTSAVSDRLLCEVRVKDSVKVVTLRSTYLVQNHTLYPLELVLVDSNNKPVYPLRKIAPGLDYSVPIEAVTHNRIKLRPDGGFGYNWSSDSVRWEELIRMPAQTIVCRSREGNEAPFRFQAWAQYDPHDPTTRKYPKITLQLRAPIELENLLPFDLNYRIFDKNTNQNWSSFLRQGGIMPVHSVQLDHLVLLNVELRDTELKPSEFAIINTDNPADFDIEKQLSLSDQSGRRLDLRLNYYKYPDSGGAIKIQIYSPFILVNRTGLPATLRSGTSKLVANAGGRTDLDRPVPLMFSHSQSRGNEFSLRVGNSEWSKVLSFEAPSAETEVILDTPHRSQEFYLGLSWELGLGKYKLTKVVTLAPRFLLKNKLPRSLCFREHGIPPPEKSTLEPDERVPLQLMSARDERLLTVTYPGLNAQWSAPINIYEVGSVHLRVFPPGEEPGHPDLLKADVAVEGGTIFVSFSLESGRWPFRIENDSDFPIAFSQSDESPNSENMRSSRRQRYIVNPHSSLDYAWDFPSGLNKKIRLHSNDDYRDIDILEIGNLVPFKFRTTRTTSVVSLDVRAEAGSQTLNISNYVEEYSLYKPKLRRQNSLSRSDTLTGTEAFETVTPVDVVSNLTVNANFEGFGLSFVNKRMIEVVYISSTTVKLEYVDSSTAQTINVSLGSVQVDNQLHDALYPVVLQPTPLPKGRRTDSAELPAIQASLMLLKDDLHGVLFIKYASILLQAMTISVDEDFLFAVLDLSKVKGASWEEQTPDALIRHPDGLPEPQAMGEGQELYFEVLELQPVRLSLSFMRTERVNAEEKLVVRNPLAVVVNSLTMALGNVNEASLQLNALGIKDARMSTPVILDRIIFHYRQEVLRQLYRILGSVDFLGNPVGLFNNVSSGIADVFYEPYKGVVMHGNRELGIGIAKGAASLVKKTVFGFSDSITKVTSSIGKGLSSATFDSEYQRQRRLAQRQNKPKHAIYGVAAGAEALATSVQSGIEGVIMKPIEGAEAGGAFGFFKGVGKGLVGAVAKPMVGVFDLASNVSEGIRNTTTVFDGPQRERVRIPRHVPYDGILTPYSQREAWGHMWLKDLDGGRFREDSYVAHLDLPGRDNVVILTTSHILSMSSARLRLEWEISFNRLQGVTIEDTGIRFSDKSGREYDRFILVPKKSKTWFFKEIEKVVIQYNSKRRIER